VTALAKRVRLRLDAGYNGRSFRVRFEEVRSDIEALLAALQAEEARADHLLGAIVEICNGKVTGAAILAHARRQASSAATPKEPDAKR
jgi:hypothetical protein